MYEWFEEWTDHPVTMLTFTRGLTADGLMERFDPIGSLTYQTIHEADGADNPSVLVDEMNDGWLVAIERRTVTAGKVKGFLESLSTTGDAVSLSFLGGMNRIERAVGGRTIASAELSLPAMIRGDDPTWLEPLLTAVEHLIPPREFGMSATAAAQILELGCGITLSESMLAKSLPCREIRDPHAT